MANIRCIVLLLMALVIASCELYADATYHDGKNENPRRSDIIRIVQPLVDILESNSTDEFVIERVSMIQDLTGYSKMLRIFAKITFDKEIASFCFHAALDDNILYEELRATKKFSERVLRHLRLICDKTEEKESDLLLRKKYSNGAVGHPNARYPTPDDEENQFISHYNSSLPIDDDFSIGIKLLEFLTFQEDLTYQHAAEISMIRDATDLKKIMIDELIRVTVEVASYFCRSFVRVDAIEHEQFKNMIHGSERTMQRLMRICKAEMKKTEHLLENNYNNGAEVGQTDSRHPFPDGKFGNSFYGGTRGQKPDSHYPAPGDTEDQSRPPYYNGAQGQQPGFRYPAPGNESGSPYYNGAGGQQPGSRYPGLGYESGAPYNGDVRGQQPGSHYPMPGDTADQSRPLYYGGAGGQQPGSRYPAPVNESGSPYYNGAGGQQPGSRYPGLGYEFGTPYNGDVRGQQPGSRYPAPVNESGSPYYNGAGGQQPGSRYPGLGYGFGTPYNGDIRRQQPGSHYPMPGDTSDQSRPPYYGGAGGQQPGSRYPGLGYGFGTPYNGNIRRQQPGSHYPMPGDTSDQSRPPYYGGAGGQQPGSRYPGLGYGFGTPYNGDIRGQQPGSHYPMPGDTADQSRPPYYGGAGGQQPGSRYPGLGYGFGTPYHGDVRRQQPLGTRYTASGDESENPYYGGVRGQQPNSRYRTQRNSEGEEESSTVGYDDA